MSGLGAPSTSVEGSGLRVAVVASTWHEDVVNGLVDGALRALDEAGVAGVNVVRVPGSFELPVAVGRAADRYDAVVALGVVVRGETPHFDYICQAATAGLSQVALTTGVPVGFGLLTCDTVDHAIDRAGLPRSSSDKGAEAARSAVASARALEDLA